MTLRSHPYTRSRFASHRAGSGRLLALAVAICLAVWAGPAQAKKKGKQTGACSATALAQRLACDAEAKDDGFHAQAICLNVGDEDEREECFEDAEEVSQEARERCRDQYDARRDLCGILGEGRYDPDFDPDDFDDDFTNLTNPNPWFPLAIGNRWVYQGGDETVTVEVQDETKRVEGVTCIVVSDRVEQDGEVTEDTDDWFGQRKDGTIDYCGEISQELETFEGDVPQLPELVSIEGSFKAGRDGDESGTLFPGMPVVGTSYRQEWSPGNAEDWATVLAVDFGPGSDPELHAFVPPALVALLCSGNDCVVTGERSTLSPGAFERKYYAPGIGLFLEVDPDSGDTLALVDCNFDAKCSSL